MVLLPSSAIQRFQVRFHNDRPNVGPSTANPSLDGDHTAARSYASTRTARRRKMASAGRGGCCDTRYVRGIGREVDLRVRPA